MTNNKNVTVNVSGIVPALSGTDEKNGNWFLIDESGEFSLDRSVTATIWLVGVGCDGERGEWNGNRNETVGDPIINTGTGTSYAGSGGDGGKVFTAYNIKIPKNQKISSIIAQRNDKNGTSINISGSTFKCNQTGYTFQIGGKGGNILKAPENAKWAEQPTTEVSEGNINGGLSKGGTNGILTPYGYVGSSGGGGAVCNGISSAVNGNEGGIGAGNGTNHRSAGTDAINYGCGGGGGAICGWVAICPTIEEYRKLVGSNADENSYLNYSYKGWQIGGLGMKGCIIISYIVEQPTLIVQKHYKKVCNTHKTCNTDYYSNNSRKTCCGNTGCGCKTINGNYEYTDTIHIGNKSGK